MRDEITQFANDITIDAWKVALDEAFRRHCGGRSADESPAGDVANPGSPSQRAQRNSANPYAFSGGGRQGNKGWLNPAAFAIPKSLTFGNEGRNDLVGPTYKNVDFNASKDFPLFERSTLQFRSEFFNLFNHTNYSNPDNGVQDGSFGQILSTTAPGRQIQFAVKVLF
jgi:hypothetical protein